MAAIDLNLQDYLRCLAKRLDEAPAGSKKEIIQGACAFLGKCEQTIYELLNGVGWNASRKPRNDRGKLSVTKKEAMIVSCMVMESCRENGKKTLSVKNAIKIAIDNDLIVSGLPSSCAKCFTLSRSKRVLIMWLWLADPLSHNRLNGTP